MFNSLGFLVPAACFLGLGLLPCHQKVREFTVLYCTVYCTVVYCTVILQCTRLYCFSEVLFTNKEDLLQVICNSNYNKQCGILGKLHMQSMGR